ncbi:TlpA disulfide reductase family protein [uncultured Algibacter sp.]|uniref:TlpA disulfide reductase family protein n=1 Tax=uncultured Algibacter sp. TaxID=298659 RepID=UPI00263A2DEB|nr:TlpA disulfide reductase family protein [uncultured Algibacter sp.]
MKFKILIVFVVLMVSCKNQDKIVKLEKGRYRAELKVNDTLDLPFNFEVISENKLQVFNAEEVIEVKEITYKNDSVLIQMPVFEGFLIAKIENEKLNGRFVKPSLNRTMEFKAEKNATRFETYKRLSKFNISGNWETVFSPSSDEDKYLAKGIFKQDGNQVKGTFRTTTGDYRYLEGVLNANQLQLSTFDGAHAFLFTAQVNDSTMNGMFYSGNHWKEPFTAKRNETFELPDANTLTYLKTGYDKVEFSFPDYNGNMVSLNDDRFKDKVVLIQIMGTWCPNCLDESKYYAEFYKNNKGKALEIIALAFEYVKTEDKAFKNLQRLKNDVGITYPIVLAQYGSASKVKANEKLPMLNHILSYPTTIFIDKIGAVRKIHTGFNGSATGDKFTEFKAEFESFVNELLVE